MVNESTTFEPRLDILPPAQRRLWDELGATPPHFVLYGGTAIALRLGHRHSEDFDFFSAEGFAPRVLRSEAAYLKGSEVVQSTRDTLTCIVNRGGPVKISFFGGLDLNRVADPQLPKSTRVWVASAQDLIAVKLAVLLERAESKDYLDIDALLATGMDLREGLSAARAVYGDRFNPLISLKALTFYGEGDLSRLDPAVRKRLTAAAANVDPRQLPELAPRKGLLPQ